MSTNGQMPGYNNGPNPLANAIAKLRQGLSGSSAQDRSHEVEMAALLHQMGHEDRWDQSDVDKGIIDHSSKAKIREIRAQGSDTRRTTGQEQKWKSGESALDRAHATSTQLADHTQQTAERIGTQDFTTSERVGTQAHEIATVREKHKQGRADVKAKGKVDDAVASSAHARGMQLVDLALNPAPTGPRINGANVTPGGGIQFSTSVQTPPTPSPPTPTASTPGPQMGGAPRGAGSPPKLGSGTGFATAAKQTTARKRAGMTPAQKGQATKKNTAITQAAKASVKSHP